VLAGAVATWLLCMSPEQTCDLLKLLADPVRLRLVVLLYRRGTLCVCELEQITGAAQYTVSRNLGLLRRAGLVTASRDGARMDYRLAADLPADTVALLAAVIRLVADDAQTTADQRAAELVRSGCCASGG